MITRAAYCTRDDVQRAADIAATPRAVREVDRALCAGADAVESLLNRVFYPSVLTKKYRWPQRPVRSPAWRLWLDDDLLSLTSLTSGGVSISTGNTFLEPQQDGPPYDSIEMSTATSSYFAAGQTQQQAIVVVGAWGFSNATSVAGALVGGINASVTALVVSDSSKVGPGDLLLCGTEYMLVTDSAMVTTSQTLQTPLTADTADVSVAVTTGSAYAAGEVILLDSERMEITDVSGNTLTVARAVQGTVLATHTGSTIYATRALTVVRGYAGTTAASHSNADPLSRNAPPALVSTLNLAYALTGYAEASGGYARPAGAGSRTQPQPGAGLPALEAQAWAAYGRVLDGVV